MLINNSTYYLLAISTFFVSQSAHTEILPASTNLMAQEHDSLYFEQYTQTRTLTNNQNSDSPASGIQLDTGYSLQLQQDVDIYFTTRFTSLSEEDNHISLSGGVDFQLTPKLTLTSGLAQQTISFNSETNTNNNQTSLEFSSTYMLNGGVHFFATYDHEIEQNRANSSYQVGMGFKF